MTESDAPIVLFGATSFVGRILARNLVSGAGASDPGAWAFAARSEAKLRELRDSLGDF